MRFSRTHNRLAGLSGISLLELLMALSLFIVVAMAVMVSFTRAAASDTVSGENMRARAAASQVLDEIRGYAIQSFETTYAYYNANPSDDPGGYGTAPGNSRTLGELTSPDGTATLRIEFPERDGHLREDVTDADWAMPRDLNGDSAVSAVAVDTNYRLLPVRVMVTWRGVRGLKTYSLVTVITKKVQQ